MSEVSVPFSQMPDDLIMDPDMTLSAIRVWHVIYTETLGRPGWDMSYGQIAEAIGTKRRQTAMEAVTLLLDKGWLVRIRQKDAKGDDAPNLFAICREPHVAWNVRSTEQGGTPERTTGGTPQSTTGGALQRTHRENHLPVEEPSSASPPVLATDGEVHTFSSQAADLFDIFWTEYPREGRVESKKATKEAWTTACKKASPTVILAGLRRQLPYMRQQIRGGSNFNKHAKRWLSGELWKEAPPTILQSTRPQSGVLIADDTYPEGRYAPDKRIDLDSLVPFDPSNPI